MQEDIERLLVQCPVPVRWSLRLRVAGTDVASIGAEEVLATASMGKVFLLIEVAQRFADGTLAVDEVLTPEPLDAVGDSGLWQYFGDRALRADSLAVLVASTSDNLATNVLLRRVGLPSVQAVSARLGMPETLMLDHIRDLRTPQDPWAPSCGRAADLVDLMDAIADDAVLAPGVGSRVGAWLATSVDLSMVASAFGLDPLAHGGPMRLAGKTGTDHGVLADAGFLDAPDGRLTYAVIANWTPGGPEETRAVRAVLQAISRCVVDHQP